MHNSDGSFILSGVLKFANFSLNVGSVISVFEFTVEKKSVTSFVTCN